MPNLEGSEIQKFILEIDPTLNFVKILGEGGFCVVFLVEKNKKQFALKVNKTHESYFKEKLFDLENDYNIMSNLKGITGIPKTIRFYNNVPSLTNKRRGKNALLREFIPGEILSKAGRQPLSFFIKLRQIIEEIAKRGYCLIADLNADNILVGVDGKPYFIDLACTLPFVEKFKTKQRNLQAQRINEIERRFSY